MADWIVDAVRSMGLVGVALLMFAENLFPPIPSELVVPLAGYLSVNGKMSVLGVIVAAVVGRSRANLCSTPSPGTWARSGFGTGWDATGGG